MDFASFAPRVRAGWRACLGFSLPVVALLLVGSARAQEDVWAPEIPLTRDSGVSARALGMGGAYLALSDDCAALRFNPAGLARVQRIEFAGSLIDVDRETENTFHDTRRAADLARTRVALLGLAYPFPTYRGSMVIALGYSVPWVLDREYRRAGSWSHQSLEEALLEEGTIGEWSFGYAVDASPILSLGLRASWIRGARFQDWTFARRTGSTNDEIHEVVDEDVTGYTGSLGALVRLRDWGRLGLVVDLPRWFHMEGTKTYLPEESYATFSESMTLPYGIGIGLATHLRGLLVTGDARYADWTQIDYEGPLRYEGEYGREFAYRRTWDLHAGVEYLVDLGPTAGLRLRAGYGREPLPYQVVLEDIDAQGLPVYRRADIDTDRGYFTLGVGVLVEQSITIDAAFARGSFQRTGGALREEETEQRLLLGAAFRLE